MKPKPGFYEWLTGKKNDNVTEEEIVSMVNEGHEQGLLEASEAEMITNIFELDDKEAKDIMTHRKNVVAISCDRTLDEAVAFILDESFSRFPVYDGDIDNIIGILHFRDAIIYKEKMQMGGHVLNEIDGLLRKVAYIPETRNINDIFTEMQSKKNHIEVVIDEYGQTAGIITMEDILEEIVGNIFDEYDTVEHNIVKLGDNSYKVNGITPLFELEDELGIEFDEDDYDTINGYLISKLDRIPEEDERPVVEVGRYIYSVLEVQDKMISKVRINITESTDEIQLPSAGGH